MRQTQWKSFLACTAVVYLSIQVAASLRLQRRMARSPKFADLLNDDSFASGAAASQQLVPHQSDSSIMLNPIETDRVPAPKELNNINPEFGQILDILSHNVEKTFDYKSTQNVRHHKGPFGSSVVHERKDTMKQRTKIHTTFVTTEGKVEFTQEMHGVDPFETLDGQPLAIDEIKGNSKSQTKISLGDLRARRKTGQDFLAYIESNHEKDEANNPEENIPKMPAGYLYRELANYRLEKINALEGDGTQTLTITDEERDQIAAAMLEQDTLPLHLLKPENVHSQPVMKFKDFKIFLKYRMKWKPKDLKGFSRWIIERHQSSLETISDDEMFYMAHLFHNFVAYALSHDCPQKDTLTKTLQTQTQTQDQLVKDMVLQYKPHFNELLESRLSPTQAKYFRAYRSDVEGKQKVLPSWFDQEYEKWEKSPKPLAYHVERILELIHFKMIELPKLLWSKIRPHGQALGSVVKEKWANLSQKSKKAVKKE